MTLLYDNIAKLLQLHMDLSKLENTLKIMFFKILVAFTKKACFYHAKSENFSYCVHEYSQ